MSLEIIMNMVFFGNSIREYVISLLTFAISLIVIKIFRNIILKRLEKRAEKTSTTIDDFIIGLIQKICLPLAYAGAVILSLNILTLDTLFKKVLDILGMAFLTIFVSRLFVMLMGYSFKAYWVKRVGNAELEKSLEGILKIIKVLIWGLAVIFFLDNIGFKISTVIAGLGIGGVAVALAAQAILKDLFSYFSILFDRPFEVGDFIIVGDYMGTVENIGVSTSRIRSLTGEQLIFSNTDLTGSRLRNYKRMDRRRVLFKLGVTYETPLVKLKEIPVIIENIIKNTNETTFDRAHFSSYGDFSLIIEVVYYVDSADYNKYMDIQQKINFVIKEEFEKRGINFSYPTQTIYLEK